MSLPRDEKGRFVKGNHYSRSTEWTKNSYYHYDRTGSKISEDHKRRISEFMLNLGDNNPTKRPEIRKRLSASKRINNPAKRPEIREKIRKSVLKKYEQNPEILRKISEARLRQVFPKKDSTIEIIMQEALREKGLGFSTHYPIKGQPDIAFPENKLAVFCDGCYWHACSVHFPNQKKREMDEHVNEYLHKEGWTVLRLWEHEINENVEDCVNKIMEVMK